MKRITTASVLALMTGSLLMAGMASAQPAQQPSHSQQPQSSQPGKPSQQSQPQRNDERDSQGWHKKSDVRDGGHMSRNDWKRSKVVDYRKHKRLSAPPKGYQWRQLDGKFVLVAKSNGVITTIVIR